MPRSSARLASKGQVGSSATSTTPSPTPARCHARPPLSHPEATEDPWLRIALFAAGANMATASAAAAARALAALGRTQLGGAIACDWCGLPGLTAAGYWAHQPLGHIWHANRQGTCAVCGRCVAVVQCLRVCAGVAWLQRSVCCAACLARCSLAFSSQGSHGCAYANS